MSTDWEALRKQFLNELLEHESLLDTDVTSFADDFTARLKKEGYTLTPELEKRLTDYSESCGKTLQQSIEQAGKLVVNTVKPSARKSMRDALVKEIADSVVNRRHPDGLNVSDRVWWIDKQMKKDLKEALTRARAANKSTSSIVYEMQRAIEAKHGKFAQVTDALPQWLDDLQEAGRKVMRTPELRRQWNRLLRELDVHADELAKAGTRAATKNLVKKLRQAVLEGSEELISKSVHWYCYDRQLYYHKRVLRTETANAHHEARILSTEQDDDIIGYHWRLSRSHPKPDICDWYANCEHGMGRGIWPKDKVPRSVAHPHCMCILVPVIGKSKEQGVGESFADYLEKIPAAERKQLMPAWANRLYQSGERPLSELVTDKGFKRKQDIV